MPAPKWPVTESVWTIEDPGDVHAESSPTKARAASTAIRILHPFQSTMNAVRKGACARRAIKTHAYTAP